MKTLFTLISSLVFLSSWAQNDKKAFVDILLKGVEVKEDIRYNTCDRPLLLDIYYPERKNKELLPCVVWIHGGGLTDASLDKNYDLVRWGVALTVQKGYISVSIDYRLVTERPLPAAMQDCATAVRFLKSHSGQYGIDTARIAVAGESAGGYLAGMYAFTYNTGIFSTYEWAGVSNKVACGVLWYPVTDFWPYNMIDYISPDDIPTISIHGDKDGIVPIEKSYQIQEKCREKGLDFKLYIVEGAQHGFFDTSWEFNNANRKYMKQAIDMTIRFLDKKLKRNKD